METVTFLDTHALVWIASGKVSNFSGKAERRIERSDRLLISPMVVLELFYLWEIGRIALAPDALVQDAGNQMGVEVNPVPMLPVVEQAKSFAWTRDPFDRMIVAQAAIKQDVLITKDELILQNYRFAVW